MPYIKPMERGQYQCTIAVLISMLSDAPVGHMNYVISKVLLGILDKRGINYENLNAIVGVLECVSREIQRTVVDVYEEEKRMENGDL